MKRKRNHKGFTLIELVVVIAILAILASAIMPTFTQFIDKTKKSECDLIRSSLIRGFLARKIFNEDLTISEYLENQNGKYYTSGKCPTGGTYTGTYNETTGEVTITCSDHGDYTSNGSGGSK